MTVVLEKDLEELCGNILDDISSIQYLWADHTKKKQMEIVLNAIGRYYERRSLITGIKNKHALQNKWMVKRLAKENRR